MIFPDWQRENWKEVENNPVVGYDSDDEVQTAVGDPQVILPGEFDEKWHLFCHGFKCDTYLPFLFHYISDDGLKWEQYDAQRMNVNPSFIFNDGDKWILYFSVVLHYEKNSFEKYRAANIIRACYSTDLKNWSEPVDVLLPELDWEREYDLYQPNRIEVRNPCMCKLKNGKYRLYYSAGTVALHDCGYEEPKYISFAESDSPFGPFKKHSEPIILPDKNIEYRNYGAGAIKVYGFNDKYIGLYNSIYVDKRGCSRSAINLIMSYDGIKWEEADFNPIVVPTDRGWNKTLVYQLDLVKFGDEFRLYYNAREGTKDGCEKIGCAIIKDKENLNIRKLDGTCN